MKKLQNLPCCIFAATLAATLTLLAAPPVPAPEGMAAPSFSGRDQDGKRWKSSDHIGKGMVYLYFYPKDDTAGCTTEACGLRDNMYELKQFAVDVVGVSFDNQDSHKKFAFKYNLDFPLLADTEGVIADAYGVRMAAGKKMARRVSFLIGLDGKIIHVTDSPDASVHMKELAASLAKIKGVAAR